MRLRHGEGAACSVNEGTVDPARRSSGVPRFVPRSRHRFATQGTCPCTKCSTPHASRFQQPLPLQAPLSRMLSCSVPHRRVHRRAPEPGADLPRSRRRRLDQTVLLGSQRRARLGRPRPMTRAACAKSACAKVATLAGRNGRAAASAREGKACLLPGCQTPPRSAGDGLGRPGQAPARPVSCAKSRRDFHRC